MSNEIFNISKGRFIEFYHRVENSDPTNAVLVIVLLKVAEADATLRDYDTLSALLGGANTEADFTNYARKVLSETDLATPSPDDTNDRYDIDIPDQTWTSAGGALNNTLVKAILCYDPDSTGGTDADLIPISHHDFAVTTDGSDLILQVAATGIGRAS